MKTLTKSELNERKDSDLYFKNGKPKKKYMLCRNPEYIREIIGINGSYDINWVCGGNSCPFYSRGCDDKGREWD